MGFVHHLINKLESDHHHHHHNDNDNGHESNTNTNTTPNVPPRNYQRAPMPLPQQTNTQQATNHLENSFKTLSIDNSQNIFTKSIITPDLTKQFQCRSHPVPLPQSQKSQPPIQTNSFYTNLLLDNQTAPIWTHPYALWYTNKPEEHDHYGMLISHTTKEQRVFGENPNKPGETQYYFNPAGIKSFVISAKQFTPQMSLLVDSCEKFSCSVNLTQSGIAGSVKIPCVQGMGFITSIYSKLTPLIQSGIGVQFFQQDTDFNNRNIKKYNIILFNQIKWSMYIISNTTNYEFQLQSPNSIIGMGDIDNCIIQLCCGSHQGYDLGCGGYPVSCQLIASELDHNDQVIYDFQYQLLGNNDRTVMFALPHHVELFHKDMSPYRCDGLTLDSTVSGVMQLYLTNDFKMCEQIPLKILFEPWVANSKKLNQYSNEQIDLIRKLCLDEMNDDVVNISNTDSMYSSGKILDKYCMILYVITFIVKDHDAARAFLPRVKDAMVRFASNKQQCPLVYDTTWGGLVSSAGMDGDIFRDFGNTHYNDHHFHYGYHIHAAAVLSLCDNHIGDGSFMKNYQTWVDFLCKDIANPVHDEQFPQSRSFDWFNGHSWAKGLFASFDGKDEESSSEDYHAAYGLKLWGHVTGDHALETRLNLMLLIMKRAMGKYMLFKDDNDVQPKQMIKNKVSGILFENKIDHATYFGLNLEYIQGIHMLPTTPISSFIRDPVFVRQEWDQLLKDHVKIVDDGWKGILMLNLALCDADSAYKFFADQRFDKRWLDNGMSLSWCLAFCAGVGGK